MKSDPAENAPRLKSIDALRGFDMFFITGGAAIIAGLCQGLGMEDCWLARQMVHVPWAGLAHHDTIFPLFLFLAGVSLALFYWIVDVRGWDRWTFYFRVIGMNSITIYLLMAMGVMSAISSYCFRGCVRLSGETWGPFAESLGFQLSCWLVLLFFYRKKIFLKV